MMTQNSLGETSDGREGMRGEVGNMSEVDRDRVVFLRERTETRKRVCNRGETSVNKQSGTDTGGECTKC